MMDRLLTVTMRRCFAACAIWVVVWVYGAAHGVDVAPSVVHHPPHHVYWTTLCDGQNTVNNC